ncbi:hypothetical protein Bca52824_086411 [Brassica carinata]|uniref:Uncharacterized protein n=1 Tax=Brassica carinata TaxID=52824 RepID=A0A8X7P9K3_BRACI|nr:hypothetical protein Bca52824_086411 [Brassica carinata]
MGKSFIASFHNPLSHLGVRGEHGVHASAEVLYTPLPPASKRRCGSSSSVPQTQCEDDTIPNISVDHTPNPSMEYLLPPYLGRFDSSTTIRWYTAAAVSMDCQYISQALDDDALCGCTRED